MGQKVNPHLIRVGGVFTWDSRWFNERSYKETLLEDFTLRKLLMDRLKLAGVAKIEIERSINSIKVIAFVSRPGIVIGRGGSGIEELKRFIQKEIAKGKIGRQIPRLDLQIDGIKEPNLEPYLVARNIAEQLNRRLPYKRVLAQTVERVMGSGAKGVRILLAGRIAGAEIGRREKVQRGTVPLSTIRERISYASVPALTKKGYIGVKVWINLGEEQQ